ncbi:hypothetical protein DFH07DRAFT_830130 [Mycena maculata]|uniref:HMG box domain-containing protein n=1 Tax=Mycena maculata TaxID=230809 RepID=A0AAD7ITU2_9AGAR|nr:hypothetical protein DFH07DRAFT_830130 [Mycena maculata]
MPTSRRLSSQEIDSDDGWENCELLYPDSDPETSVSSSPQAPPSSSIVPPAAAAPRRKSHARQRSATHIPRPPNPFICFRSDYCVWNKQLDSGGVRNHRLVSKLAGEAWRALDIASRQKYEELAQEKKKEHRIRYPDYAYAPTPASRLGGKGKKRRADDDCDYEDRPLPSKRRRSRGLQLAVDTDAHVFDSLPSPTNTTWKPNGPARSPAPSPELERPQTPELSPNSSSESPNPDPSDFLRTPPVASYPELEDDDGDFVATADIPPLDLYANAPEQVGSLTSSTIALCMC